MSCRPPNRKNMTTLSRVLNTRLPRKRKSGFPGSPAPSTTSLVIPPKMLIGEKPPAVAPLMIDRPMSTGLMRCSTARLSPTGAMIATAAGTTDPKAVSTAVTANMIHGMSTIRPRTPRTALSTSQSTVPFARAIANRNVTPTSVTNRPPGKPATTPSATSSGGPSSTIDPMMNAATSAIAPRLIGSRVAMTNATTRRRIEIRWMDMGTSSRQRCRRAFRIAEV
jgi:hypothetical protein